MFNFKFLNKMTKNRFNLRKVATIAACLAVTTMFASCDGKNGDDDDKGNGGGKIDSKLVGTWESSRYVNSTEKNTHTCYFRSDGTFVYSSTGYYLPLTISGTYTVSNGWITLLNVIVRRGGVIEEDWLKTYKAEYKFETNPFNDPNDKNVYLNMCLLWYNDRPELPLDFLWARWVKK